MTNETETSEFAFVKLDPSGWYAVPQAILDDPQLTHAERRDLLAEWALDLSDRSMAADEGMVPDVPGIIDADVRMQALVAAAQAALEDTAEAEPMSLPQRIWRRIIGSDQATGAVPAGSNVTQ